MSHLSLWPEEMSRRRIEMLGLVEWGVEKAHASCSLKNRVGWGLERALIWESGRESELNQGFGEIDTGSYMPKITPSMVAVTLILPFIIYYLCGL